jgi:hypothetical protein
VDKKPSDSNGAALNLSEVEIKRRREQLALSHNPYQWHYLFGGEGTAAQVSAASELHSSENPYATHYFEDRGELPAKAPPIDRPASSLWDLVLTKSDFEKRCRQIFVKYIPAIEKGKLRQHHREFIERNRVRTAVDRALLARELAKYDLASEGNIQTFFNREEDVFTQEKLLAIEQTVVGHPAK